MKSLIFAGLATLIAQTATAQPVAAQNPANVMTALTEMGYKPSPIQPGDHPLFKASINGMDTAFVFGNCTTPANCEYFVLVSSFADVTNPPADWLNRHNQNIDLGKLWINQENHLSFSTTVPVGKGQLSRETFQFVLNQWTAIVQYLSEAATRDKLVK